MKVKPATAPVGERSRGDFLFEIGCEEIPAGMILKASRELKALLQKHFLSNGLLQEKSAEASIETFGAPRRLVAIARGVRMRQEDVTQSEQGRVGENEQQVTDVCVLCRTADGSAARNRLCR